MGIYDMLGRNDSDEVVFFKRELESLKAQSYDIKYPALNAQSVFPVTNAAGPGASSIVYSQFDTTGVVKFIADYADDLPKSDVKGKQFSVLVQSLGGSYGYSIQEIRASQYANRSLPGMRSIAARRSNDQKVNQLAWFADGTADYAGLSGILFHPNVTKVAATTGSWVASATPDEIIADFSQLVNSVEDLTNGVEVVDTVLLPLAEHNKLRATRITGTSDNLLSFIQANFSVTILKINELKTVTPNPRTGTGSANVALAYTRSAEKLELELPVIYEQFPEQARNLSFVVPVHSRIAGFNIYYPLSVYVMDGI